MEKEFIPYEQALALKELGFEYVSTIFAYDEAGELYTRGGIPHDFNIRGLLSAPTFSQAFRFFREKYFLDAEIYLNHELGHKFYHYLILQLVRGNIEWKSKNTIRFKTYEEAELACLIKLIEIVKEKS